MPTVTGTSADDVIYGTVVADELHGLAGDDVIIGQGGDDRMYGEDGDDTFIATSGQAYGGSGIDTLIATPTSSQNNYWLTSSPNFLVGGFIYTWLDPVSGQSRTLYGDGIEIFYGSNIRDFVQISLPHSYEFHGGLGDDYFYGTQDNVRNTFYGDEGDDFFEEGSGLSGDVYDGGVGNDYFWIRPGLNSEVIGGDGFDTLELTSLQYYQSKTVDLASGAIAWGAGFEGSTLQTFTFSGIENFIIDPDQEHGFTILGTQQDDVIQLGGNSDQATNRVYGRGGNDVLIGFESGMSSVTGHWFSGGAGADLLRGGAGEDQLFGDEGDDVVLGGVGNDVMEGGDGFDVVSYADINGAVVVSLANAGPQNTQGAGSDRLSGFEGLEGTGFADQLTGDGGDNVFWGGLGDDLIDGGGGRDRADYEDAEGGITVNLGAPGNHATGALGVDTLISIEDVGGSAFGDTLSGNGGGNRLYGRDGDDQLVGMAGADFLYGGDGEDRIDGGADNDVVDAGGGDDWVDGGLGDDQLAGGDGFDSVSYAMAAGAVVISLGLSSAQNTGAGADTITGFEQVIGGAFNDTLGGGSGDDFLEGGAGDDTLSGGGGLDVASYASASGAVTVSLAIAGAQNTGGAGLDILTAMEGLRGSAFDDTLTGDGGDNILEGGLGADTINGGGGSDTASYRFALHAVNVDLAIAGSQNTGAGGGLDTLVSIENLTGSRYSDTLYGNNAANIIRGGGGAIDGVISGGDTIDGRGGDDILILGSGGGTVYGGDGDDIVIGGGDSDNLNGDDGDDYIDGGDGGDVLWGGSGVNILVGGAGDDQLNGVASGDTIDYLYGGAGNDNYFVTADRTGPQVLVDEGEGNAAFAGLSTDHDLIVAEGAFFWDFYSVAEELRSIYADGTQLVGGKNVMFKTINGGVGDDIILTYGRSSVVDAGDGTDAISFGLFGLDESYDGVNTLIMKPGNGMDYLYDFESGVDKIDLSAFAYGLSGAQWKSFLVDVENGDNDYCFLYLGQPGQYLVFVGMTSSQLSAWDFIGG